MASTAAPATTAQPTKIDDMTFMFLMLNAHKQGSWKFQAITDTLGLTSAKAAESRYYKLKKTHWDTVGGAELLQGFESAVPSPKPSKAAAKGTPKSKKRQMSADADGEDEEAPPTVKRRKEEDGDAKKIAKEEPASGED
ncbi:hypothetical protein LTR53_014955 [Teratosphaeriaceae sp. CCFEE 6253]|nr:hypothetical protein LTR53_014955 [Teratosphaeriaceae sp. CCFEE 6253]